MIPFGHGDLLEALGLNILRLEVLRLFAQLLSKSYRIVHEIIEASFGAKRCWRR